MKQRYKVAATVALSVMGFFALDAWAGTRSGESARPEMAPSLVRLPLRFEPNLGQAPGDVRYLSRGKGYSLLLADDGATLMGHDGTRPLRLELSGARRSSRPSGIDKMAGLSNYLVGQDRSAWLTSLPQYRAVHYRGVYPGVDLVVYGTEGEIEYDFVVGPNADPRAIRWRVIGAHGVSIDPEGNLVALTANGVVVQRAPRIHQDTDSGRRSIEGGFVLDGDEVSFRIGPYDSSRTLVIDPVLSYASYLGGTGGEAGYSIAVDADGFIYVTGYTTSTNFPTATPLQPAPGSTQDVFVAKLDPSGTTLVYSTYLGGNGSEVGRAIAVNGAGEVTVAGETNSSNFPTANAFQPALAGSRDAFVTKLAADGTALLYSTYLGGAADDVARGLALDAEGLAHVVGYTYSSGFPIANAWRPTFGGSADGFAVKLASDGLSLVFATFLNGTGDDFASGVAVGSSGDVCVAGQTSSTSFPTINARQSVKGAYSDGFVLKLTGSGVPVYSTFLGGNANDKAEAIAMDDAGTAYVAGSTESTDFPTVSPFQTARAGGSDAFVTKVSADGSAWLYSTYLGGAGSDSASKIAVDSRGRAHVAGSTYSSSFPTVRAIQTTPGYGGDGFAAKLASTGSALVYSTYFGGSGQELLYGAALDGDGTLHLAGSTASTNLAVMDPIQNTRQGTSDVFIAKIADPNEEPVANAGLDQTVELPLVVTLSGISSSDPNGDPLEYEWRDSGGNVVATTVSTTLALGVGIHTFTLTVADEQGLDSVDTVTVTVLEEASPVVTLSKPRDTTIYSGVPVLIDWTATDNGALSRFDVYTSSDGGAVYAPVPGCSALSGSARGCSWASPGPISADTRLRIVATDAAGHASADVAPLAILGGVIAVTSPNSSTQWPIDSTQTVTWAHNLPADSSVNVEVSVNGGATWTVVGAGVSNFGSFDWRVRPPHSANARLRVSWTTDMAVQDTNDADITIGTPAYRVKNIRLDGSSSPVSLTNMNGRLFFVASDSASGKELWKSDGTEVGTVIVKDITPGPVGTAITDVTVAGAKLYFTVAPNQIANQLWRSDGTAAGTVRIDPGTLNNMSKPVAVGNSVFFTGCDNTNGCELWRASAGGMGRVVEINPGLANSSPGWLTNVDGVLFFTATQGTLGTELWKSDGTAAGTVLVKDLYPGVDLSSHPAGLVAVGNTLYFTAITQYLGRELHKSDGTGAGTAMVANLAVSYTSFYMLESAAVGNQLFLRGTYDNGGPSYEDQELYKSDGTEAGTGRVKDIAPGEMRHSRPSGLSDLGGTLYFTATEPTYGLAVWRSDGTGAGTIALKSFIPGIGGNPSQLKATAAGLFFSAWDAFGQELWRTDGTPAGTFMVQDISAGTSSSSPTEIRVSGHRLFFVARDSSGDAELWTLPLPINAAPTVAAGSDRTVEVGSSVMLTATGADGDGDTLAYEWRDASGAVIGATASISLALPVGAHTLTVSASDGYGGLASDAVVVTVQDTIVPSVLVTSPEEGQQLVRGVPLTVTWTANDNDQLEAIDVAHSADGVTFAPIAECAGLVGSSRSCTWVSPGPTSAVASILVSVRDASGNAASDEAAFTLVEPFLLLAAPSTAVTWVPGSTQTIAWSSNLGFAGPIQIELSRDGGGSWSTLAADAPNAGAFTWLVTPPVSGSSRVRLRWSSDPSVFDQSDVDFTIDSEPVASAGGPYSAPRGQAVVFDGAGSSDPDGDALTWAWDFGDGSTSTTGPTPTHAYSTVGSYTVSLIVGDGLLTSSPATATVTISNQTPVAAAGGPYAAVRSQLVTFAGSGSSDPDGDELTWAWDFGDGSTGTGVSPTHAYTTVGAFTVTLTVNDGTVTSTPVTALVTISNQLPTASAGGPYSGTRTQAVSFSGLGSIDPDGDPLTYAWNFGDGTVGTGATPIHTYSQLGSFTLTLTVDDGAGASPLATSSVQITNVAPTVVLTLPVSGSLSTAPATIALAASASDPDGSISKVEFYAGSIRIGEATAAPYEMVWSNVAAGLYSLTAHSIDDSGAITASVPVLATVNAPPVVAFSAPADGAQFATPASITLTVSASDVDGTVAQVEFFQGPTSLGVATTFPYSVTWNSAPAGSHVLTARVRDNLGATVVSSPITIKVTAKLLPTADAAVRGGSANANSNFGTATTLTVQQSSSAASQRWTYVKFDLTTVSAITIAKLRLFGGLSATTGSTVQTAVYPVSNTTWSESGITWNNKPTADSTRLGTVSMVNNSTAQRWYEWDVTAYLQQEKAAGRNVVTLVLKNLSNSSPFDSFRSKEAASNRPELFLVP